MKNTVLFSAQKTCCGVAVIIAKAEVGLFFNLNTHCMVHSVESLVHFKRVFLFDLSIDKDLTIILLYQTMFYNDIQIITYGAIQSG